MKIAPAVFSLLVTWLASATGQNIEWNVLFHDWRNIGPFPAENDGAAGFYTEHLNWTGAPDESQPVKRGNVELQWKRLEAGNVYTQEPPDRSPAVYYAAALVRSEKTTEAVLAFGAHHSIAVWHGTEKIFELPSKNRSRMDNYKVKVSVKAGDNWFLFKTQSDVGAQRVLARLLPANVPKPLVAFRYVGEAVDTRPQEFPDILISFLDKNGKPLEQHRVSGNVSIASELPFYSLYTAKPSKTPANVEVRFAAAPDAPGGAVRIPWKKAISEILDFEIAVPQTFHAMFPDRLETEKLKVFESGNPVPFTIKEDRRAIEITISSAPGVYREFVLTAAGFKSERFQASPEVSAALRLQAGCDLTGRVINQDGKPIAGANVRGFQTGKFLEGSATTGNNGDFLLPGLPVSTSLQLLITPPDKNAPGIFLNVATGQDAIQKLEGDLRPERAARLMGTIRQPFTQFRYTRILCTGQQGFIMERVGEDGSFDLVLPPGNYLSAVAKAPDLQPARRLVDLTTAPALSFDFELKPARPAYLEFLGPEGRLISAVNVGFSPRDGGFPITWFGLGDGRFALPNPPPFPIPATGFGNVRGRTVQFLGVVNGSGTYKFEESLPQNAAERMIRRIR